MQFLKGEVSNTMINEMIEGHMNGQERVPLLRNEPEPLASSVSGGPD